MNEHDLPDPIAALDQAVAGMRTLATIFRAHFDEMVAAGFSEQQAFALTLGYQAEVVRSQMGGER